MGLVQAARLFALKSLWRATGLQAAGRALVRALSSPDEGVRTIAGMFLVQAGEKAEPLVEEALRRRENLPMVLCHRGRHRGFPPGATTAPFYRRSGSGSRQSRKGRSQDPCGTANRGPPTKRMI